MAILSLCSNTQTTDGDHGRIETRRGALVHDVAWLAEAHAFPGLMPGGKVTAAEGNTPLDSTPPKDIYIYRNQSYKSDRKEKKADDGI